MASEFYSGRGFEWVIDHVPECQVNALFAWSMLNGPWGGLEVRSGYVAQELRRLTAAQAGPVGMEAGDAR